MFGVGADSSVVRRLQTVMSAYQGWWALAGGWSTDVGLGRISREHHDIEISCARAEKAEVWQYLTEAGADLRQINPPGTGWRIWRRDDPFDPPSFQVQARLPDPTFDVFFETIADNQWLYRRNSRISRPLAEITSRVLDVPVLRPEVQARGAHATPAASRWRKTR